MKLAAFFLFIYVLYKVKINQKQVTWEGDCLLRQVVHCLNSLTTCCTVMNDGLAAHARVPIHVPLAAQVVNL